MIDIITPSDNIDMESVRELFLEYAHSLSFSLCFQDFDKEIEVFPGKYAPPKGALLLGRINSKNAGCVAFRPLDENICEMKRLYVRPEFRGSGLGRLLCQKIIDIAFETGYVTMKLDTLSTMHEAKALYRKLGFVPTEPYCHNPFPEAEYYKLDLKTNNK